MFLVDAMKADPPVSRQKINNRDLAVSVLIILIGWQLVVWITEVPRYILPGPLAVAEALVKYVDLLAMHAWVTAIEVVAGLILGILLGMVTAMYLIMSATATRYIMPILVISQTVPVFALAPILTLWFGYGIGSKIAMAVLIIYFPVVSSFLDGLRATPKGFLDLAQSMRATKFNTLIQVRLPAALPSLSSGIRLATVYAPIGAIIGEWVGASQGLGYLMLLANGRVKIDLMFEALVTSCIFTLLLRAVTNVLCNKLDEWAGQSH
ncbi:MAG: putative hydroxymethylpyrimidine transport system permease protein [Parasphingorhabdus sp.]|jgi:putative hydroxymethylpyrimidine transport system permease protein